jgi:hypothetical protein
MTNEEIISCINDYLNEHASETRGYIRQEPYRGDLFELFAAACSNRKAAGQSASHITSDGLVEEIAGWSRDSDTPEYNQKKLDLLRKLGAMWAEWDYAWQMYPSFHHRAAA